MKSSETIRQQYTNLCRDLLRWGQTPLTRQNPFARPQKAGFRKSPLENSTAFLQPRAAVDVLPHAEPPAFPGNKGETGERSDAMGRRTKLESREAFLVSQLHPAGERFMEPSTKSVNACEVLFSSHTVGRRSAPYVEPLTESRIKAIIILVPILIWFFLSR